MVFIKGLRILESLSFAIIQFSYGGKSFSFCHCRYGSGGFLSLECFEICSGINANADRLGLSVLTWGRFGFDVLTLPIRPHTCAAAALHNDSISVIVCANLRFRLSQNPHTVWRKAANQSTRLSHFQDPVCDKNLIRENSP